MHVRQAVAGDADGVADLLARAFADYEWTRWTVAADDHFGRVKALQRMACVDLSMPYGEVWVASDAVSGPIVSAAMWMRPAVVVPDDVWAALAPRQASLEGDRHDASVAAEAACAGRAPSAPHWFLGAVGTESAAQRRGFARAVLAPVLSRGGCAYLETCGAANVAFYESLGFVVTATVVVPDDGPVVSCMTRG